MTLALKPLKEKAVRAAHVARSYASLIFILFLLAMYGFLAWRISVLTQAEPSDAAVTAQLKTARVPHIDQNVLNKIQQLQDNSVNVQTLFDEARSNPFQE